MLCIKAWDGTWVPASVGVGVAAAAAAAAVAAAVVVEDSQKSRFVDQLKCSARIEFEFLATSPPLVRWSC